MSFSLICEGPCNMQIGWVDRLVSKQISDTTAPHLTEYEIAKQRTLRYTPHEMVNAFQARCADCKTVRRYGSM